jgi:hypothetical protein
MVSAQGRPIDNERAGIEGNGIADLDGTAISSKPAMRAGGSKAATMWDGDRGRSLAGTKVDWYRYHRARDRRC